MAGLYAATAAINGLHPDWLFGFCLPARFLLTAVPALLLGLAVGIQKLPKRAAAMVLVAFSVCVSWDGILVSLFTPEVAYDGRHMGVRTVSEFYPLGIHFFDVSMTFPILVFAFWSLLLGAVAGAFLPRRVTSRGVAAAAVAAALLPALFGLTQTARALLSKKTSPHLLALSEDGRDRGVALVLNRRLRFLRATTGEEVARETFATRAGDGAGLLSSYVLPGTRPGGYVLTAEVEQFDSGQAGHHILISQRRTQPASQDWEERRAYPIDPGHRQI